MIGRQLKWMTFLLLGVVACGGRVSTPNPTANLPESFPSPIPSLTSTLPATPTNTPPPLPSFGSMVSVVFLPDQQSLPVFASPDPASAVIAQLEPNQTQIPVRGEPQERGGRLWVEIQLPQGGTGWVDAQSLTTTYAADQFCSNPQIQGLTVRILDVFRQKDGRQLAEMVSPIHGLRLRMHWSEVEVFLGSRSEIQTIFSDPTSYLFGRDKLSQTPIEGTFMDVVYPTLMDVWEGGIETCNALNQGIAADWVDGFIQWPFEYANLNYLARYRPAPEEDSLNWRMWAFGIEWIDQRPFLTVLVHYQWDF